MQEDAASEVGVLHVSGSSTSFARQRSTADRQSTQTEKHASNNMEAVQPVTKLLLDARKTPTHYFPAGNISVATESWLDRATAKAKASVQERKESPVQ